MTMPVPTALALTLFYLMAWHTAVLDEHVADVLGLSIPHVNRMLRRLREDGLIELMGPRVRIVDRLALMALRADPGPRHAADRLRPNRAHPTVNRA